MYRTKNLYWLFISLLIVVFDQITKYLAVFYLSPDHSYPVSSFFEFTLIYNKGTAFSLLNFAAGWQHWILSILAVLISIWIIIWLLRLKAKHKWLAFSLSCILGGAIGNLVDRVRFGYVIDFIDLYIKRWHWPVFNVADMAITCGMLFLIVVLFYKNGEHCSPEL